MAIYIMRNKPETPETPIDVTDLETQRAYIVDTCHNLLNDPVYLDNKCKITACDTMLDILNTVLSIPNLPDDIVAAMQTAKTNLAEKVTLRCAEFSPLVIDINAQVNHLREQATELDELITEKKLFTEYCVLQKNGMYEKIAGYLQTIHDSPVLCTELPVWTCDDVTVTVKGIYKSRAASGFFAMHESYNGVRYLFYGKNEPMPSRGGTSLELINRCDILQTMCKLFPQVSDMDDKFGI